MVCEKSILERLNDGNYCFQCAPGLLVDTAWAYTSYPGGHNEGFPDTFKQLYHAIYEYISAGDFTKPKLLSTFEGGHDEVGLYEAI